MEESVGVDNQRGELGVPGSWWEELSERVAFGSKMGSDTISIDAHLVFLNFVSNK